MKNIFFLFFGVGGGMGYFRCSQNSLHTLIFKTHTEGIFKRSFLSSFHNGSHSAVTKRWVVSSTSLNGVRWPLSLLLMPFYLPALPCPPFPLTWRLPMGLVQKWICFKSDFLIYNVVGPLILYIHHWFTRSRLQCNAMQSNEMHISVHNKSYTYK